MNPWECPRCRVIHAGWVDRCDCTPPTGTSTGKLEDQKNCACAHPQLEETTGGYRCTVCGKEVLGMLRWLP